MNKNFIAQVDELKSDIEKLAKQLNLKVDDCMQEAEKRIDIEKTKMTKGRNPNKKAFIGAAYFNIQTIYRLYKNAEEFIKHQMNKEMLEKLIYFKFRLASEAYGVAVGGHELKLTDSVNIQLRNEEYIAYARKIQKEKPDLNQSSIIRHILSEFKLGEEEFRNIYRIIFK